MKNGITAETKSRIKNRVMKRKIHQAGFSLLEVMIAITIFALFITAYMTSEGYNVLDSSLMRQELILQKLCKNKLMEVMLKPPAFNESLTLTAEVGNFAEQGYPEYEFKIEYKKLELPDLSKIQGGGSTSGNNAENSTENSGENSGESGGKNLQQMAFKILKDNIEEILWQVKVTVNEKGTDFPYSLSTLVTNEKAKVKITF